MVDTNSEHSEPWNSAAFFDSDPDSREIRNICAVIVNTTRQVLIQEEDQMEIDRKITQFEHLDRQLVELGIKPGMHVGQKLIFFKSNPLNTVEYVAGQLRVALGKDLKNIREESIRPFLGEQGNKIAENAFVVDPKNIDNTTRDYVIASSILNRTQSMLALTDDDLKQFDD